MKFDEVGTLVFPNVFASVIPLDQGLITDKIEFSAIINKKTYKGIEIWENGLGLQVMNYEWKKGSEIEFSLYSSSD